MNFSHFAAIVRLRWQIARNQFAKSGLANRVLFMILVALAVIASLAAFGAASFGGYFLLADVTPTRLLYLWDAIVGGFLFFWAIALMVELQRSELLSLKNLLHLPVSLAGAFVLNYASSLISLTLLLFLPGMLGLALASALLLGAKSLVVFPLIASFVLMVTAISYQLRGWLARLMDNKRKRGTVMAITTMTFVMLAQAPNLLNMWNINAYSKAETALGESHRARLTELNETLKRGEIDGNEYSSSLKKLEELDAEQRLAEHEVRAAARNRIVTLANVVLPVGWLPYGASAAAAGGVVVPWLCVAGMTAIGVVSLALAYRSTLRVYTGSYNKEYRPAAHKSAKAAAGRSMLERSLPLFNEGQSAVAMATLRSLLRAPEAKMALLTPLIFGAMFGSMMFTGGLQNLPAAMRPWLGVGAIGISLFGVAQLMLNIFGLDRHGFRGFVLSPTPRRDILIGKNMGVLPFAATLAALLVVFTGVVGRMELAHLVATLLQVAVTLLVYFTITNFVSVVAPIGMAAGTMKPVSVKVSVVLWQFAAILLVPVALLPAASAVLAEQLAGPFGGVRNAPLYLLLTLIELPLAIWFYRRMATFHGRMLQEREQAILEVVSKVAA